MMKQTYEVIENEKAKNIHNTTKKNFSFFFLMKKKMEKNCIYMNFIITIKKFKNAVKL